MDINDSVVPPKGTTKKKRAQPNIVSNKRVSQTSCEKTAKIRDASTSKSQKDILVAVQTQAVKGIKSTRQKKQRETICVDSDDDDFDDDTQTFKLDSSGDKFIAEGDDENTQINEENSQNTVENILFVKYFRIVEDKKDENKNVAACCLTCEKEKKFQVICRGSLLATSNFIRHLKV